MCARGRREGKVGATIRKTTKTCPSHMSEDVVMPFCIPSVAVCDLTCFKNEFGCVCVCAQPS